MSYNNLIDQIFRILIPRTTMYNVISKSSLQSSKISMFLKIIMYLCSFQQIYLSFCFDCYTFIFWLFSFDTLQVLMFVCPIILELRFYGWCYPCYIASCLEYLIVKLFVLVLYSCTLTWFYVLIYVNYMKNVPGQKNRVIMLTKWY